MIYKLIGILDEIIDNDTVSLNVNGVCYQIFVPNATKIHNTNPIALFIEEIRNETQYKIYGFTERETKTLFTQIMKINKLGPKIAFGIVSNLTHEQFKTIVISKNAKELSKIPGIGNKVSAKIIHDFGLIYKTQKEDVHKHIIRNTQEIKKTLKNLGFDATVIDIKLSEIITQFPDATDEEIIKKFF